MSSTDDNIPEYKVTEFNKVFNETVSSAFDLIRIRGEISNLKKPSSGHLYFNLKDENSIINAVCWNINKSKLTIEPEDGLEIVAKGKITTYAKSISVYQLNVENIEIAGEGALLKLIEERKKKLEKLGYFKEENKKTIPFLPNSIGVITSPTGAVLKDIIHRIKDRFKLPIQLWPTPVQGKDSSLKIIEAIKNFNSNNFPDPPDVIIVARGGGSIEDLMPFNDEKLALAVYNSKIPIISAIGHETDYTIIDLVSDLRVPTPTAAAEKAVPIKLELIENLYSQINILNNSIKQIIYFNKENLNKYKRLLHEPKNILLIYKTKLENLVNRKNLIINNLFNNYKNQLQSFNRLLNLSSVEETLKRGYAIVKKNNKVISNSNNLNKDDLINIQLSKGSVSAKIKKN